MIEGKKWLEYQYIAGSFLGRARPTGEANGRTNNMYNVYVLKSEKDGNLYVGCTKDLLSRLEYHNSGKVFSTKSRRPLRIIYVEEFKDKYEAFNKEKYYKTPKGKKELKEKIKNCGIV